MFRLLCLTVFIKQACLLRRQARLNIMTGVLREAEKGIKVIITIRASETGKNSIVL